jgi:hypothetical protein
MAADRLTDPCFCGDPTLTHLMGAKVTHTPTRCHFTTGSVGHLRVEVPPGTSKDDLMRQVAAAPRRRGRKS